MDTGTEIYSDPYDDDITIVPQHTSTATASSSSATAKELLSKKEGNIID